jgi:hypothetical protein
MLGSICVSDLDQWGSVPLIPGTGILGRGIVVIRLYCYLGEPLFRAASRDSGPTGRSVFLGQGMSSI